jgi:squalene-associated FAD-dependent desaturase
VASDPPTPEEGAIKRVVILGAGLAGLAAAQALSEAGLRVLVLERKSVAGGRASSFVAQDSEEEVDNCQHVLMRCCTNLLHFYQQSGVADRIRWFDRLTFLEPSGRRSVLRGSRLPAPFHLFPSFFRSRFLSRADKQAIARAMMAMLKREGDSASQSMTALDWLLSQRQTPRAIDRFWRVILVSALNEEPERCAAAYAWQIFRLGFLGHRRAFEMGVPAVPLRDLYDPCVERIHASGGEVRFRQLVRAIDTGMNGHVTGARLDDGTLVPADYVISAVPFEAVPGLLPESWADHALFRSCRQLEASPISAVHLWFDRQVTSMEHAVLLDRTLQWMFNKTRNYERSADAGSYLGLVVSASRDWLSRPRREILATAEREVRESFPAAREARLVKSAVIKEARATFSATPSADGLRPPAETPLRGFYLAGDWVQTGWPATMEGAVRSGYHAAERILAAEKRPARVLQPDLPWESVLGKA